MLGCGLIPTFNLTFHTLRGWSGAFFLLIYTQLCIVTSLLFSSLASLFSRETRSHMFLIVLPSSISLERLKSAGWLYFTLIPSFTEPPSPLPPHPTSRLADATLNSCESESFPFQKTSGHHTVPCANKHRQTEKGKHLANYSSLFCVKSMQRSQPPPSRSSSAGGDGWKVPKRTAVVNRTWVFSRNFKYICVCVCVCVLYIYVCLWFCTRFKVSLNSVQGYSRTMGCCAPGGGPTSILLNLSFLCDYWQ